jgi:hypothetical protein
MYDQEPEDWISEHRKEIDEKVRQIASARLRYISDREKHRKEELQHKHNRELWGFIIAVIACLATVLGVLLSILRH